MAKRSAASVAVGSDSGGRAGQVPATHATLLVVGTVVAFTLTFLFRYLSAEFTNDHFMHLAEGRQVLFGEWPARDYFDFGLPLQVLTATLTLLASGHNLYGEALVTVAFIAAGVACTFVVATHLSRSLWFGAAAAVIAALASPRLYNYPKAFFYIAALWLAWRYAQRPERRRAVALALMVGVAFLYRHDHGIYIGVASIVLFLITHWKQPRAGLTAFATYAGVILLVIAPFLLFVQLTIGLPWYVSDLAGPAQAPVAAQFQALPITIDRSEPWFVIDPPAERRFNVRWQETLGSSTRAMLESKYLLMNPRAEGVATWSYSTGDEGHANIRALVDEPAVVDTSGIDRGAGVLAVRELWYEWLQRRVPLFRMHIAPGLFREANALPIFYYATLVVPILGLLVLPIAAWRGSLPRQEGAVAAMAVLLSIVVIETLVRGSPDSRLPDVTTVVATTGAWIAGRLCRAVPVGKRRVSVGVAVLGWLLVVWAAGTNAHAGEALNASRMLTGPTGIVGRFDEMRARLQRRPIDTWANDETGYRGLTRYAAACTQRDDRFLVTWFEPIMYFYAEREFAGRHPFFDGGWQDSARDQQATVDRMMRQQVPIVFVRDEFETMFRKYFPIVAAHIDRDYVRTPPGANGAQVHGYQVWVEKSRTPIRVYERLGLPCFR